MKRILALSLTAASLAAAPANAAVQYDFTAFSSFDINGEQITRGGFSFIASSFLTGDTTIPLGDLLSCSVSTTNTPKGECRDQRLLSFINLDFDTVGFNISTLLNPADVNMEVRYYFADNAFGAVGTYDSLVWGEEQAGRLVVTDLGGNAGAIPEPRTWLMMVAGFGLVGAVLRRPRRVSITFA